MNYYYDNIPDGKTTVKSASRHLPYDPYLPTTPSNLPLWKQKQLGKAPEINFQTTSDTHPDRICLGLLYSSTHGSLSHTVVPCTRPVLLTTTVCLLKSSTTKQADKQGKIGVLSVDNLNHFTASYTAQQGAIHHNEQRV